MIANLTERLARWGSQGAWLAGVVAGVACAVCPAPALAQGDAEKPAATQPDDAELKTGGRWLRVVEEDDGKTIKLQLVSREYRKADGPSVFLTGAVHIADASFYKELQEFLDGKDVVLFEGVKPPGAGRLAHNEDLDDDAMVNATKRRIRFVATFVEKFKRTHKKYPATLDELAERMDGRIAKLLTGCTLDAWGRDFTYVLKDEEGKDAPGFEISSLGADGKPAGEGADADLAFSQQPPIERGEIVEGEGIQRQLATALRLKFQLDAMDDTKANWRNSDLSVDQVMDRLDAAGADPDQLFSLVGGGSMFDAVLGFAAKLVGLSKTLSTMLKIGMVDMLSHADELLEMMGGEMGEMMQVIIEDRNRVVADDLAAVLRDEPAIKTIGIIYGAGHLPDLEERLTEMGLKPVGETWFTAITVDVRDAGLSAAEARETRKMINSQMERQLKTLRGK